MSEFIVVRIADQPDAKADVLINGQHNGQTGKTLTLGSSGWVMVSVDRPGAQGRDVDVGETTPSHPMEVEIKCA